MKDVLFGFWNEKTRNDKQTRAKALSPQTRRLHIEPLESRDLLAVTSADFDAIRDAYPDLNLSEDINAYNVIEITANELTEAKLRNVIDDAEETTDNDLIVIRTTATQNAITLSGTELYISCDTATKGSLTLVSLGEEKLTIDADQKSRVLSITNGSTVALAGLNITGGYATRHGGGIYNSDSLLTITHSVISGNEADDSNHSGSYTSGHGGGIYNSAYSTLTIINSVVSENSAYYSGGGIYNRGILTVTNNTISGNSAFFNAGAGLSGGGINNSGQSIVTNCTITENFASSDGGGISDSGELTVLNSTISENKAGGNGGGIRGGSIIDCVVSNNTSEGHGGGIYDAFMVLNSTITANDATVNGGGVFNCNIIRSSVVENNSAGAYGGGIYGAETIIDSEIRSNKAILNGGGIYLTYEAGIINDCVIESNTSDSNGGGIYAAASYSNTDVTIITNSTIQENNALQSGGGIYAANYSGNRTEIYNCQIEANSAGLDGGGISGYSKVINCEIIANYATRDGGGIMKHENHTVIFGSTIQGNLAGRYGGGVCREGGWGYGDLYVYNSDVHGNEAFLEDSQIYEGITYTCSTNDFGNCNRWTGSEWIQNYYVKYELPSDFDIPEHLIPDIITEDSITEGESLKLDASNSLNALIYEWDLNNDGQYDDAFGAVLELSWEQLVELGFEIGKSHWIHLKITGVTGESKTLPTLVFVWPYYTPDTQMPLEWEYLARTTAYEDWRVGQKIGVDDYVVNQVIVGIGLYAIGLVRSEESEKSSDPILVFRGTADLQGVYADADPRGIAYSSYQENRDELFDWMHSVSADGSLISIVAHSLGGAWTQWLAADWTSEKYNLGAITTFNSPGISKEGADNFVPSRAQSVTHHVVNGDIVSMAGEAFIAGTNYYYSFSGWDIHAKHSSPLTLEHSGKYDRPEDLEVITITTEQLNSSWFYHSGDGFFGLLVAASKLDSYLSSFFTRGTTEDLRKTAGNWIYSILTLDSPESGTLTLPEIEILGWKLLNLTIDWDPVDITGVVGIQTPDDVVFEGIISFHENTLNTIGVKGNHLDMPLRRPYVYLQSAGLELDHITDDQPLLLTGSAGLSLGPRIMVELPDWLGGNIGPVYLATLDGILMASSEEFILQGELKVAEGLLAEASGRVEFNWKHNYTYGKLHSEILSGIFNSESSFFFSWNDPAPILNIQGKSNIRLPDEISFIGGVEIASASTQLIYVSDSIASNDFVEIIGSVNIPFVGVKKVGIKVYFDGTYQTTGLSEVTSQSSRSLAFAEEDSEGYLVLLNWEEEKPGATGTIILPNGDRITENDMIGRSDIALVPELSLSNQRAYFVKESLATISSWSYEVSGVSQITSTICEFNEPAEIVLNSISEEADNDLLCIDMENINVSVDAILTFYLTSVEDESIRIPVFTMEQNEWNMETIEFIPNVPNGDYILSVSVSDNNRVSNEIVYSSTVSIGNDPTTTKPTTPTDVFASSRSSSEIFVSWNVSEGATQYDIQYRKQEDASWIAGPSVADVSATVSGLLFGTTYEFQVRAVNVAGESAWSTTTQATTKSNIIQNIFAIGADAGPLSKPIVQVYDADTGDFLFEISLAQQYGENYTGGVRVATGDLNGDGIPDIAVAPGRNMTPDIYVFNGIDGSLMNEFYIPAWANYGPSFKDGLSISIGDVIGNDRNDIILVPSGGQAVVQVFENDYDSSPHAAFSGTMVRFNAFEDRKEFIGGASVAVGDVDTNINVGKQQIILGTGPGIAPIVRIFDVENGDWNQDPIQELQTTPGDVYGGVNVAVGDINGDGVNELIVAQKNGGRSLVEIYLLYPVSPPQLWSTFQAYDATEGNNVAVNIVAKDSDGDGVAELYTTQAAKGRAGFTIKKMRWNKGSLQPELVDTIFADWPNEDSSGLFIG